MLESCSQMDFLSGYKADIKEADFIGKIICWIWLCLPFIYLVERSPADASVSLIVALFIYRSILIKDWRWLNLGWFKICLAFGLVSAISALSSDLPFVSLFDTISWFRFPLLAVTGTYLISKYKNVSLSILFSSYVGILLMCSILTAEVVINFEAWTANASGGARLTWPYGDPVSGNYLAKFGLPSFIIAITFTFLQPTSKWQNNKQRKLQIKTLSLIIIFLMISFTFLTGERMNTLIIVCSGTLALLFAPRKKYKTIGFLISAIVVVAIGAFYLNDFLFQKFAVNFIWQILNISNTGYWHLWMTGIDAFLENPVLGLGPGNFRFLCEDISTFLSPFQRCDNHPHNFLSQILAETGFVGTILYIAMILVLIRHFWKKRRATPFHGVLFVVPVALFFPFKSNADFFGQWNNLMIWYGIALASVLVEQKLSFFGDFPQPNGKQTDCSREDRHPQPL